MTRTFQLKAKLLSNKRLKDNYLHCILNAPQIAKAARPGQFVNIRITDTLDPLLRRPLSIHRVNGPKIEILYEVAGRGTQILSEKKAGEYLDIIGPLGNGFTILNTKCPLLVAGGMGVAPLLFLAEKTGIQYPALRIQILIGAKTKKHIHCEKEFKELGCEVKVSTDDGSKGFKGRVSDLLKTLLSTIDYRLSTIYGCGPKPMLKEIALISRERNIPAQISMEEHIACGIGACLGCAVETIAGYRRVCKDGPVFEAQEIIWRGGKR